MLLGTCKLLLGQTKATVHPVKEVEPYRDGCVPLWQMLNDVTYCQQLPTDQAGEWTAVISLS